MSVTVIVEIYIFYLLKSYEKWKTKNRFKMVNVSNFVCDKNNTVLLSKFGDREILQKYTQK